VAGRPVSGSSTGTEKASIAAVIQKAGDADSDSVRLEMLRKLRERPKLNETFKADLDRLISQIDRYINEKNLTYFGREVGSKTDFDFGISEDSVLYPLTWLYRGRMVIWFAMESGGVWANPPRRSRFFGVARSFFEKYSQAFPENRIARMYLAESIGPKRQYEAPPGAPQWAIYQREGLERLSDIIEWWIDNRMRMDGQYGGGWGDDCEMWRWWVPVLIGFHSPKIADAQARFSDAMMAQPHMAGGYTNRMTDVEHTAEDSADVITPMMHLDPDNPVWLRRALRPAELMESLWTAKNERGLLQFKSTYFTVEKVDTNPQRACDTVYHPRAVQPALLYWQRTADERLTRLFSTWMNTWVDAAARSERGKPAGIIPSAIHFPDGKVGGLSPDWWDPRNHGEHTLYLWPSAMSMMTNTLLLTYHMTGEQKYLEPIRSMAKIRLKYMDSSIKEEPAPGSELWCARQLGFITGTIAKYRFLTANTEFDELLEGGMSPYMRLRLKGDRKGLTDALRNTAEALRINFPGYTSEVRYTDRVLRFPSLFSAGFVAKTSTPIRTPDTSLLYSSVTGDPGGAGYFPLNAVRWLTPPRNIAALVTDSGTDRFSAELFNFQTSPVRISAELYLLVKGKYTLTIASKSVRGRTVLEKKAFTVRGPRARISFELPPQKLCTLVVAPTT
jgi:DNA-binding transcriptional ArsR family regulator